MGVLSRIGGAIGSLFGATGGRSATGDFGQPDRPAPHVATFGQILNNVARAYSYRSDEAIRNSHANALAMRRDCFIRALLNERCLATARRKWQLDIDNPDDPHQQAVRKALTDAVKAIPRFGRFRRYMMEATWYGRYGSQGVWERKRINGQDLWTFTKHQPVNGDKIQFQWDGTPAVMVNSSAGLPAESLIYGDRTPLLKLDRPDWRRQFVIHTHEVEDADYFEGEMAGAVNGVGLRSHIYWAWWLRDEMLSWAVDFMQKVGTLGLLIFWYEQGNKEARARAETNAQSASSRTALVAPRPAGKDQQTWGIEQIAPQTGGIEALQSMISEYFERHIERLIVGQSMSSGADNESGLGGTGRADFAKDTKHQILAWDAENLDDTLSEDLIGTMLELNFPDVDFPVRFKSVVPDPEKDGKLDAIVKVWDRLKVATKDVYEMADIRDPEDGEETIGGEAIGMPGTDPMGDQGGPPLGGILGNVDGEPLGGLLGGGSATGDEGDDLDAERWDEFDDVDTYAAPPERAKDGRFGRVAGQHNGKASSEPHPAHAARAEAMAKYKEAREALRAAREAVEEANGNRREAFEAAKDAAQEHAEAATDSMESAWDDLSNVAFDSDLHEPVVRLESAIRDYLDSEKISEKRQALKIVKEAVVESQGIDFSDIDPDKTNAELFKSILSHAKDAYASLGEQRKHLLEARAIKNGPASGGRSATT